MERSQKRIFAIAMLLVLPSLWMPYLLDDWVHLAMLEGRLGDGSHAFDLFEFVTPAKAASGEWYARGFLPWWTDDDLRIAFCRPLASLTHFSDHRLFGRNPVLAHAHSLLWFAATLGGAWLIFRRALSPALAALAFTLFALDDCFALPTTWIANRNTLVALAPAIAALLAHMRWREDGWRPGRWLTPLLLAVALAGGEPAYGIGPFLFAFELLRRNDPAWRRMVALLPTAITAVLALVVHRVFGYGAEASGMYLDPFATPAEFFSALPARALALLGNLGLSIPADLWAVLPRARPALAVGGVLALPVLVFGFALAGRELPAREARAVRALALGAVLAILPMTSVSPSGRNLVLPALGIAPLLAVLLRASWRRARTVGWRRWSAVLIPLGAAHLVLAPLIRAAMIAALFDQASVLEQAAAEFPTTRAALAERDVVFVNAPDFAIAASFAPYLWAQGFATARTWRTLAAAPADLELRRVGPTRVELRVTRAQLISTDFERLYRARPFATDTELVRGEMRVRVLETNDKGVTRVRFDFAGPLEDPRFLWLAWRSGRLVELKLPPVGESITLLWTQGPLGPISAK